jgi:hypothetical protein
LERYRSDGARAELRATGEVYLGMRFKVISAPSNAPVEIGTILSLYEAAQLCEYNASDMARAGASPAGVISPDGEIRLKVCDDTEPEVPGGPEGKGRFCCESFTQAATTCIIRMNGDGTYLVNGSGIVAASRCPWCGEEPGGRRWW